MRLFHRYVGEPYENLIRDETKLLSNTFASHTSNGPQELFFFYNAASCLQGELSIFDFEQSHDISVLPRRKMMLES